MPGIVSHEETWWSKVISGFEGLSPFFPTLQASLPFFQLGTIGIPHPDTKRCAWILPSWLLRKRTVAGWFLSENPQNWSALMRYRYDMCFWIPQGLGLYPWLSLDLDVSSTWFIRVATPNLLTGGVSLSSCQQPWPKRQRSPCRRPIAEKGSMDGWSPMALTKPCRARCKKPVSPSWSLVHLGCFQNLPMGQRPSLKRSLP